MHLAYFMESFLMSLNCCAAILIWTSTISLQSPPWYFEKLSLPFSDCSDSKAFFSFVEERTPFPCIESKLQKRSHIEPPPNHSPRGADFQEGCCREWRIFKTSLQPRRSVDSQITRGQGQVLACRKTWQHKGIVSLKVNKCCKHVAWNASN